MSKLSQKVELTANILIIVVAVLLVGVITQKYFFGSSTGSNAPTRVQPTVGAKINLPEVDLSAQPKTLVLVLQKGCRYCTESAAFYKRLQENTQNKNIKLVAVLPGKTEESTAYLGELGIINMEVKQSPLDNLQTSGTPTLILTNDKGEVTNFWIGKLPADKEDEVINQLNS
jgi:thioredoxin-related protein